MAMVQKQIICVAAMIPFSLASGHSGAQEIGSARQGLALAQQVCAECHAVQKQHNQSPNSDAPTFQRIASVPGMSATALSAALHTSHATMPNLVLDPDQLADITAYILSLK
jgi:mono/diheme cytochrome c family protein